MYENLDMHLVDVVTTYLYGSLDNDIYMKVLEWFKILETYKSSSLKLYSIKLQRSLYGLKHLRRMWYNHLSEYLFKEGYQNNINMSMRFYKENTVKICYYNCICWWF